MQLDWHKMWDEILKLNWDWNEIDICIYTDDVLRARRMVRDKYKMVYGQPLKLQLSRDVVDERKVFLERYQPYHFAPEPSYFEAPSQKWEWITSKFDIIRLHAEWNVSPTGPHIAEINLENSHLFQDLLVCFAECVMKADDPLERLLIEKDVATLLQQTATVFDPDFPRETHEQMLARAEAILQEQSKELGVPYFLPSKYNPNWRTIESWDYLGLMSTSEEDNSPDN